MKFSVKEVNQNCIIKHTTKDYVRPCLTINEAYPGIAVGPVASDCIKKFFLQHYHWSTIYFYFSDMSHVDELKVSFFAC